MKTKSIIRILLVTACILLVPLIAMQFTQEVKWDLRDFIVIGILLICSGLIYELGASKLESTTQRVVLGVTLAVALVLIWVELAVGIFGTPFAGS